MRMCVSALPPNRKHRPEGQQPSGRLLFAPQNAPGGTQHDRMTIMGIFAAGVRNGSHAPGVPVFSLGAALRAAAICAILRVR